MTEQLETVYRDAGVALDAVTSGEGLKAWEQHYLGKKGLIIEMVRSVGMLPKEDRAAFGKRANEIKSALEAAYAEREAFIAKIEMAKALQEGALDVTLPARPRSRGGLHPATLTLREFYRIWADLGFQVFQSRDGPTCTGRCRVRSC